MENIILNNNIDAIIFDCDGTLVDSMPLHMKAWEAAFNELNKEYKEDFLFSLKGMKETDIIKLYNTTFKADIDPDTIVNIKHKYFLDNIHLVEPIVPVVEIARKYFNKLPLAVVSGSVKDIVHKELQVTGIINLFNIILTASDPFKPKPSPDIFLAASEFMKAKAQNCIVFEDGDPGLEAAINAGMKTVDVRNYI
jgi:beta-phosphoglucomutase-like phosphatase (HAD superfamily)